MSIDNSKTEWSIIEQSTVVQQAWSPLRTRILGESKNFPSKKEIMKYKWWPYALWSLFEHKDNNTIRVKSTFKAQNLIETVFLIREFAAASSKTELSTWFSQGLFDAYLFRLCTTKSPKRISKKLYAFIKNRSLDTVRIPEGSYWIGNNQDQQTSPYHMVKTGTFSVGIFPVTQLLWFDTMEKSPSKYKGATRPVEQVSWFDAIQFCNSLSAKQGREPYYNIQNKHIEPILGSNGYRLPTEAQWELTARAEKSFGSAKSDEAQKIIVSAHGWMNQNSGTRPIGQKKPNAFGLYDVHGNVFEWCWDYYGSYQNMVIPRGKKNPYYLRIPEYSKGPQSGVYRCYRGGSWNLAEEFAYPYRRMAGKDDIKSTAIGLRICCAD